MSDTATTTDRPPLPAQQESERRYLGAMLHHPNVILDWSHEFLSPSEFDSPTNGRIHLIACNLREHAEPITARNIIGAMGEMPTRQVFPGYTIEQYIGHLYGGVDVAAADALDFAIMAGEDIARRAEAYDEAQRVKQLQQDQERADDSYGDTSHGEVIQPTRGVRFALKKFDDVKLSSRARFLVRNIIPLVGITVIWGPPKCGKSFWLFDLLMHVALGWTYRGLKVQQGIVIYLVLEGDTGFSDRLLAFRQHFLPSHKGEIPFYIIATRLDLVADGAELMRDIKSQLAPGAKVAAIAIDTLNRSLKGSENNDQDMGNYIKAADLIKETFNCAVPIVHHSGVGGERPRGHTSLTGAVDSQIAVKRNEAKNIVATVEYMKDGAEGHQCLSSLKVLEIGREDTGEEITSCIVETVDKSGSKVGRKITDAQHKFMEAVFKALADSGQQPAKVGLGTLPRSVTTVVDYKVVRDVYRKATPQSDDDEQAHNDRIRQALSRASREMQNAKVIGYQAPYMWFTGKPLQGFSTTTYQDQDYPSGLDNGPADDDPRFLT